MRLGSALSCVVVVPSLAALVGLAGLAGLAGCAPPSAERLGAAREASVCATGTVVQGVDVSSYEGDVDWPTVKSSGVAFGIAKATEGLTIQDGEFANNWAGMKSAGVIRGAYHFFYCDDDPVKQADYFLAFMGTLEKGDLPPTLDFEDRSCDPSTAVSLVNAWLDEVASKTGTLPIIYTSESVLEMYEDTSALAGHAQLWVADWQVTCPTVPSPFTGWPIWQYSSTGTVPGIDAKGAMDLDEFNGDMSALVGITFGNATPPASSTSSSSGGPPLCSVNGVGGTCIDTSVCAGMSGYMSTAGLCPGSASEQCCTPIHPVASSSASGAGGAKGTGGASGNGGASASSGNGGSDATLAGSTSNASSSGAAVSTGTGTPSRANASSGCAITTRGDDAPAGHEGRVVLGALALALAACFRRRSSSSSRNPERRFPEALS